MNKFDMNEGTFWTKSGVNVQRGPRHALLHSCLRLLRINWAHNAPWTPFSAHLYYYSSLMVWLDGPRTIIKTSLISHLLIWYMVDLKRVATNWVLEVLMGQWIKLTHTVFNSDCLPINERTLFFHNYSHWLLPNQQN